MPISMDDPRLQTALERVNMHRRLGGVAPCKLNAALVNAAQAHAEYYLQNGGDPHQEVAGKPGFTGADWFARTRLTGYVNPDSTNENVTFTADPVAAVDGLVATVNHRTPILDPTYPDIGFGFGTSADGKRKITVMNFGLPAWKEVFEPAWIIYPPENATGFPRSSWKEAPDPFAAFPAKFPIGNPITLMYRGAGDVAYDGAQFSLKDANGNAVPIYALPQLRLFASRKSAAIASQVPLAPDTTYTVTFAYSVNKGAMQVRSWRFSTGGTLDNRPVEPRAGLSFADANVRNVWKTADEPVATGKAQRSWVYGPDVFDGRYEPYAESPGGRRVVYYFDKARLEINNPGGDRNSQWFVTAGRLVHELVSGQMQTGDNRSEGRPPARVEVAGDPLSINPNAPTYATFQGLASLNNDRRVAQRTGQPVLEFLNAAGQVSALVNAPAPVKYEYYDQTLGHNVPDVLLRWMNALPAQWIFILGLPLSEPYWTRVKVGGVEKDVLVQIFERRAVTYTPSNSAPWQVEMGNVGRHYFTWRYS
jgi:hypothetical protein